MLDGTLNNGYTRKRLKPFKTFRTLLDWPELSVWSTTFETAISFDKSDYVSQKAPHTLHVWVLSAALAEILQRSRFQHAVTMGTKL